MGKRHHHRHGCPHGWHNMGEMTCLPYAPAAFSTYGVNHQFKIGQSVTAMSDHQCSLSCTTTPGCCYFVFHTYMGTHHVSNGGLIGGGNCELFTRCYPSGSWDRAHACRAPNMQCSAYQYSSMTGAGAALIPQPLIPPTMNMGWNMLGR